MLLKNLEKYRKSWNLKEPKGSLVIVSGPSGVGKGTIVRELIKTEAESLVLSISVTTRKPRPHEVDGKDYFFKSIDTFSELIEKEQLLEYACIFDGKLYGTPRSYVEEQINAGKSVILEIDVQGAMQIKKKWPDAIYIFILPPTMQELERRLRNRQTENEEDIRNRLAVAQKELDFLSEYDYLLINDELEQSVQMVRSIIIAEHCKTKRNL